ncbi:long-chain-acyl-CoA synthetase [Zavarzinia compransoris]|uniref:Long-chain-acyl-CoA synthetase n=1 Tax=Zavarzinia compransoris TaxID=1264899 RepID=A0A317E0P9_9PROT|nr:long-chain-acyl-CoA synthetase [Zavarzinia compransoris]PWR20628.1 long-chain-acyl-CoA synthetase [Zavarzinia compransoris]TDP44555.1 fatty-acyl-CoA synthase [Zavarzinia compransoris]
MLNGILEYAAKYDPTGLVGRAANEVQYAETMIAVLRKLAGIKLDGPYTVVQMVEQQARRSVKAPAIVFEGRTLSWAELDARANQVAHWAQARGIEKGDVIALMMANRPEFVVTWLGLAKAGATIALINTNLTGGPLAHSLTVAAAKALVIDADYAANLDSVRNLCEALPPVFASAGAIPGADDFDAETAAQPRAELPRHRRPALTAKDNLFYIYTSGTTGNPKAAHISHYRFLQASNAFAAQMGATRHDRMYCVLPLYHSAGCIIAVGSMLAVGGTVILRRRFSASQFWDDVVRYEATCFQYIGELCRYLVNTPPHRKEQAHKLRVVCGNGLRPEIWPTFQDRFKIPRIVEFYAATEGNVALMNADGKVGAIGRIPWYLDRVFNTKVIRFDIETEQPVRDARGFCIECPPNEVGETIGLIPQDPNKPVGRFEGYKGKAETEKKILRDVFETGDMWFRTGDLMRRDQLGYFYFVDRIGDTFRWKGENVSTAEVAEALTVFPGVREVNVYGVQVPNTDGRAGMASIVAADDLDLEAFDAHIAKALPAYAQPYFLRLQPEIEITGTFKHRKVDLVKEGFDPAQVADPLYIRHPDLGGIKPLTPAIHADIAEGRLRF